MVGFARGVFLGIGLAALSSAGAARAAITEILTTKSFGILQLGETVVGGTGRSSEFYDIRSSTANVFDVSAQSAPGRRPGAASVSFHNIASDDGNFSFLHTLRCVGTCSLQVDTTLTLFITNSGPEARAVRVDSLITPGHMAIQGLSSGQVDYSFNVTQHEDTSPDAVELGLGVNLYQSVGTLSGITSRGEMTTSTGRRYNGLTVHRQGQEVAWDWGATPLSVVTSPIAPGTTTRLDYRTLTTAYSFTTCEDGLACPGLQIAYGDPRNNGGISLMSLFGAPASQGVGVLDVGFDVDRTRFAVVDVDAPPPPPPPLFVPPTYAPGPFAASAVPEPATWAMMIIGFGAVGFAARRRAAAMA